MALSWSARGPRTTSLIRPHVKLLAVLRDPVLRTYSHWKERVREGAETLSFADALAAEPERVGNDAERLSRDPGFHSSAHENQSYLEQSRYGASLGRWLEHFPASAFHLLRSEDYYADQAAALDGAAEFLGIEPGRFETGVAKNAAPGESLDADTRAKVEDLLRDDAIRLRDLTGISWDWV